MLTLIKKCIKLGRLGELHNLRGHVEYVLRLKNLDLNAIQSAYTVWIPAYIYICWVVPSLEAKCSICVVLVILLCQSKEISKPVLALKKNYSYFFRAFCNGLINHLLEWAHIYYLSMHTKRIAKLSFRDWQFQTIMEFHCFCGK